MSAIKKGDLVMVVRLKPCCGNGTLGAVRVVLDISGTHEKIQCLQCGSIRSVPHIETSPNAWTETARVIKIDPPALPESVETKRETTA